MAIEIIVPTLGESVSDATVARWIKTTGDNVAADEPVVELETDKVTLEVPAPAAGQIGDIVAAEGSVVEVGAILARLEEGVGGAPAKSAKMRLKRQRKNQLKNLWRLLPDKMLRQFQRQPPRRATITCRQLCAVL